MKSETKEALDTIVDVITCADGGRQFLRFKSLLEEMEKQAEEQRESSVPLPTFWG